MIKWETLKLTTITMPMKSYYSWLIPVLLVTFIFVAGPILIESSKIEEGQEPNTYMEKHGTAIATICGLIAVFLLYILQYSMNINEHYKITVEIENPNINIEELVDTPTLTSIEKYINNESGEEQDKSQKYISYFRKSNTKLYTENNKTYFTTIIYKPFYERYKSPEQFKEELSWLVDYTIECINKYPRAYPENKEAMKEFTEKYATDKIKISKFEDI